MRLWPFCALAAIYAQVTNHISEFDSNPNGIVYFEGSSTILLHSGSKLFKSVNDGESFSEIDSIRETYSIIQHPFEESTVLVFTSKDYWITEDRASNWRKIDFPFPASRNGNFISFNSADKNRMIIRLRIWSGRSYTEDAYYTTDSFKSTKLLLSGINQCEWANGIGKQVSDDKKVYCLKWPKSENPQQPVGRNPNSLELVASSNYYENGNQEVVNLNGGVPVLGVIQDWLVAISKSDSGYHLMLSKDGLKFQPTVFVDKNGVATDNQQSIAFSVLQSTNSTMFVDIVALVPGFNLPFPFGTLYASSSDGSYFTASLHNTNRDLSTGLVDFEHIQATMHEGVLLANTVKNWEDIVNRNTMFKQLSTKMSFDNGRTWSLISPPAKDSKGNTFGCSPSGEQDDNCALHLHSVTTSRNVGRVFSVSSAPGIIIGVGNVGPNLLSYSDCDTFLSDDSGVTWREIQKGSHKFEIMNFGSTLVLVPDGDMTVSYIIYSKDRGKKWEKYELKIKGNDWVPRFTAIDPSSKSRKILIYAVKIPTDRRHYFVQLDFESLFSRKCDSNDLETWVMKGKGDYCVLGTTWEYRRRKENADCYMGQDFKAVPKMGNPCRCTDSDYECDLGFARVEAQEKVNCISVNTANDQPADCKIGSTYKGLSGYRFIPGTRCRGGNDKLGEPITKECKNIPGSGTPPGEPKKSTFEFDAHIVEIAEIPSTSIVYVLLDNAQVWRSKDFGVSWKRLEFPDKEPVFKFILHESELNRLVFMSTKRIFFAKDDKIDELPAINELKVPEEFNVFGIPVLDIHPTEPEWYAFVGGGSDCATATSCHSTAYITKDSGKKWSKVQTWVTHCAWAHDIYFDVGTIPKDAVFCTTFKNKPTNIGQDKVPVSDSNSLVFEKIVDGKSETLLDNNVLQFFVDYNYVLVATGNENAPSLYSSTDGVKFELIQFPPGVVLDQKSITLLESNSTGIFASFKGHTVSGEEYGNLLKSSVNGLYFSKLIGAVNQNSNGVTDFQKIPGSFLTLLSNIVTNPKSIRTQGKTITSVISHDGGVTWSSLIPPKFDSSGKGINCESKSDCSLHLNLRADSTAFGKMLNPYGSESTAGVFLGVGNWGNKLIEYDRGNLYITSDYGHNFTEVAKGPHLWTFAEHGSLIVAVEDIQYVDSLKYSWNYGKSWATLKFASTAIRIELIVGFEKHAQVLLTGHTQMGTKTVVYQLDFKNLYQRQCDESDIESAEFSSNLCIMGTKYLIRRRKPSSTCSLGLQFNSLVKTNDLCECAESDYECIDKYFRNEIGQCSPLGNDPYQPADCKNGTVYQGKSGYQKLKLDTCIKGQDLTKPVDRKCGEDPTGPDMIRIKTFKFDDQIDDYFYFKSSTNIIAKDIQHNAYLTKDEGATWTKIDTTDRIVSIMEDESFSDRAFMFTEEPIIYMMMDRGENILKLNVQGVTNLNVAPTSLITHPTKKDWMIWIGAQNCKIGEEYCHTAGQVSWDSGKTWNEFDKYVKYCVWAQSAAFHSLSEQSFFCSVSVTQTGDQRSFTNYDLKRYDSGSTKGESILKINAFAIESQYLIASIVDLQKREVKVKVTMDGTNFAEAVFESGFQVRDGYTILDSSTGNLYMHLIKSFLPGSEFGTLFKSNWNGTFYHKTIDYVNQNRNGYVDFEKVQGINGTLLVNTISNVDSVQHGDPKQLITMISMDDGDSWKRMPAPSKDSNGNDYNCGSDCFLNLHAFTERKDHRDEYSSIGAVGLMVAAGNVGKTLSKFNDGNMYLSMNGGLSWKEVAKNGHMYEIIGHGGIIIMVNDEESVDYFLYSLDGGNTFLSMDIRKYTNGDNFRISNIISEPSGTTFHATLFGKLTNGDSVSIHLDFEKVYGRECVRYDDPVRSDFEYWALGNSSSVENCVFGAHVSFERRKPDRQCAVGELYQRLSTNFQVCECTYADFECDQYHTRDGNKCVPTPGITVPQGICENGLFHTPTGYVKRKISQCGGGLELDIDPNARPCSNSSFSWFWFFFTTVPIAGMVGYGVQSYRNGAWGRYGRIQLPVDTAEPVWETRTPFQRFMANSYNGVVNTADFLSKKAFSLYAFVQSRIRRSEGYEPVNTHYYDPDLPTPVANELVWDDESQ